MSLASCCNWQLAQVAVAKAIVHFVPDLFVYVETSVWGDVCMRLKTSFFLMQYFKMMCTSEQTLLLLLRARSHGLRTAKGKGGFRMLKCLTCLYVCRRVRQSA